MNKILNLQPDVYTCFDQKQFTNQVSVLINANGKEITVKDHQFKIVEPRGNIDRLFSELLCLSIPSNSCQFSYEILKLIHHGIERSFDCNLQGLTEKLLLRTDIDERVKILFKTIVTTHEDKNSSLKKLRSLLIHFYNDHIESRQSSFSINNQKILYFGETHIKRGKLLLGERNKDTIMMFFKDAYSFHNPDTSFDHELSVLLNEFHHVCVRPSTDIPFLLEFQSFMLALAKKSGQKQLGLTKRYLEYGLENHLTKFHSGRKDFASFCLEFCPVQGLNKLIQPHLKNWLLIYSEDLLIIESIAETYWQNNEYKESYSIFKNVLEKLSSSSENERKAKIHFRLAQYELQKGAILNFESGYDHLDLCLKLEPSHQECKEFFVINTFDTIKKEPKKIVIDRIESSIDRFMEEYNRSPETYHGYIPEIINLCIENGQIEKAQNFYIHLKSEFYNYFELESDDYLQIGQAIMVFNPQLDSIALDCFERARNLFPCESHLYSYYDLLLMRSEKRVKAIIGTQTDQAEALIQELKWVKERIIEINNDTLIKEYMLAAVKIKFYLGQFYTNLRERSKASEYYRQVFEILENHGDVKLLLFSDTLMTSKILFQYGSYIWDKNSPNSEDSKEGLELMNIAVQFNPDNESIKNYYQECAQIADVVM